MTVNSDHHLEDAKKSQQPAEAQATCSLAAAAGTGVPAGAAGGGSAWVLGWQQNWGVVGEGE